MAGWQLRTHRGLTVRPFVGAAIAVLLIAAMTAPTSAAQTQWEPTTAGWLSGPIEHVTTVEEETGGAVDVVRHGDHLYVTSWRSFSIYDVSDPLAPQRLSTEPLGPSLFNEEPQTNGEILLVSRDVRYAPYVPPGPSVGGVLEIYDVRDKRDPEPIGQYASTMRDHLWTCLDDCRYAYSAFGTMLDLSDPTTPQRIGDWREKTGQSPRLMHHIAEVADGKVLVGSVPMLLLDTTDPTAPHVLASVTPPTTHPELGMFTTPESIPARVTWPRRSQDRFSIVSMETPFTGPCSEESGKVLTFDTAGWNGTGTFDLVDTYQISSNGTFSDGKPPHNVIGCGAYGLDPHPDFNNGGTAAVVFFEHGLRLLDVNAEGKLTEVGGFLPHAGNSVAPIWVTDDILYVIDLHRGIDVLLVDRDGGRGSSQRRS